MERKVKYSYEFKLKCVQEVLKKNRTNQSVSKEHGFDESNLRRWIGFYQKYGSKGLEPRGYQSYNAVFKLKVLQAIEKKSLSLSEACLSFNIPTGSVIVNWQKRFEKLGYLGLENKPKGRPRSMTYKRAKKKSNKPLSREEELLLENESLRAENELLKKLQALIQAEEAAQSKKRKP
jgi:transposase